ncbi:outer membrane protein assembly factor BamB family protein [Halovenus marina]|uniref:outer membrane protein assembly factor BamB family protein n=1 Tax=Halovenus marina TaxID=3396621 RepID=UPI003F569745
MSESEHNTSDRSSIDRRTFMKGAGWTVGAAAVGSGATGAGISPIGNARAGVLEDTFDWATDGLTGKAIKYSYGLTLPTAYTGSFAGPSSLALAVGGLGDSLGLGGTNDSPTAGDVSFHQTTTNSFMGWQQVSKVHIENQIENSQMLADIEARNAIADAWEDGKTESEASQAALDAIDGYHSILWRNTFVSKQANALQIAYVMQTAANTTEADYSNWTNIGPTPANADYTGSGSIVDGGTQISPNTTQTDITLPNGETPTLEVVEFSVEWDNGDTWSSLLDNSFLDGYDSASGEFTFSTDQGNEFTDDFTAANLSVPDANLPSKRILNCADLADALNRIEQNATDLKQNYDLERVGQIYTALDNGDVTPNQIRGVAGLAEHLSGTSDATEGRYQIALSTLTGVPRPDLSQVATVTIEHTGPTDIEISVDADGTRQRELTGSVTDQVFQGQIFASSISSDLSVDNTYLTNLAMVSVGDGNISLVNPIDQSVFWTSSIRSTGMSALIHNGEIFAGDNGGYLYKFDRSGQKEFEVQVSSAGAPSCEGIKPIGPDTIATLDVGAGKVAARNVSDGSIKWEVSLDAPEGFEVTDSHIYVADAGSNQVTAISIESESTDWTVGLGEMARSVHKIADNRIIAGSVTSGTPELNLIDTENQSILWSQDTVIQVDGVQGDKDIVAVSETDFIGIGGEGNVKRIKWSDSGVDETVWTQSASQATPPRISLLGPDIVVTNNGTAGQKIDISDGSKLGNIGTDQNEPIVSGWYNRYTVDLPVYQAYTKFDGIMQDAQFSAAIENGMDQLYLSGETTILEMKDADGNPVNNVNVDDFGPPQYDSADISEWSDYMAKISDEFENALDEIAGSNPIFGSGGWNFGGINIPTLPGFGVIETVIIIGGGYLGLSALSN